MLDTESAQAKVLLLRNDGSCCETSEHRGYTLTLTEKIKANAGDCETDASTADTLLGSLVASVEELRAGRSAPDQDAEDDAVEAQRHSSMYSPEVGPRGRGKQLDPTGTQSAAPEPHHMHAGRDGELERATSSFSTEGRQQKLSEAEAQEKKAAAAAAFGYKHRNDAALETPHSPPVPIDTNAGQLRTADLFVSNHPGNLVRAAVLSCAQSGCVLLSCPVLCCAVAPRLAARLAGRVGR